MTRQAFYAFIDRIEAAGVDRQTAGEYAGRIGDTPWIEGDEVVVRDDDERELARLPRSVLYATPEGD
jgi:hypothetical protein